MNLADHWHLQVGFENNLQNITSTRRANAHYLDSKLSKLAEIKTTKRLDFLDEVFHLYMFTTPHRDQLVDYLHSFGIDAKIHYPIPMHLQPAAKSFGYKLGDFPVAEYLASACVSLPVHEFITEAQLHFMVDKIYSFFKVE